MNIGETSTEPDVIFDLITEVAELDGVDPVELPPLGDYIDTDALRRVLSTDGITIAFEYHGYEITLTNESGLRVQIDPIRVTPPQPGIGASKY